MVSEVGFVDGRGKADHYKRAEITDQQAATSASALEASQQPMMLADMGEFFKELLAKQKKIYIGGKRRTTGRTRCTTAGGSREDVGGACRALRTKVDQKKMWAEEDARKWAEHKASLREEASRWRGATEVRSERLQDVETAQTVPSDSADTCESSGSIPVIGLARRPARRPTRRSAGRPAERPAGRAAGRPAGRPERRPARRLAGRPAKRPRDARRDGQ